MTRKEPNRPLSCHQKDMYDLQRKYVLVERELKELQERTKDCYPKEFVEWTHRDNNVDLQLEGDDEPSWWVHLPDLNWRRLTLDELFTYWNKTK